MALVRRYLDLPNITLNHESSFFLHSPLSTRYDNEKSFEMKVKILALNKSTLIVMPAKAGVYKDNSYYKRTLGLIHKV